MNQAGLIRIRTCMACGAQELTNAAGMARHAAACKPDRAYMRRRRAGKCVRCGKPSLPYVLCERHRFESSLRYALNRGARYGLFVKSYEGRGVLYAMGNEHARVGIRGFQKHQGRGRAPRGFFPFVAAYLQ